MPSNYPPGAEHDPNAPYNEPVIPEKAFVVTISQTLSKTVKVYTDKYQPEYDEETGHTYAIIDDVDWKEVYEDSHFKIQDLLEELKSYVQNDMALTGSNTGKGRYLKRLLEACDNWVEDEYEVIEENS